MVIDWWVVAGSKAAERGSLAVGHDAGTALVSRGGDINQSRGVRQICLRDSRPVMLPMIADCKEADDAVAELASTPGPVDLRDCGTEGWLDGREVICALNDDTSYSVLGAGQAATWD